MKISLNEIKKLVPAAAKVETDELVRLIGSRLVEVEGTEDWSEKYRGIYIVKVVSCEPIPDTHLHLCQIDVGARGDAPGGTPAGPLNADPVGESGAAGPVAPTSSRKADENLRQDPDLVQVVCGAPNVKTGMFAVWIAPGAIVPQTFGTSDEFEIGTRKMRGYESSGMLAGLDELALGDDHSGIVEIDPEMPGVKPGAKFAEVFDLNDTILDIENKSLTHRPDTFGLIGFAREVSGILGEKFAEPTFSELELNDKDVEVKIADPELCSRYSCAVLKFDDAPRSKYLTKDDAFLAKADMKSISPIVDVTNILMLITGQPLHAFDYDKFVKVGGTDQPEIIVRAANPGEKLTLLDDKEIECDENDILITSSGVPVALAGAMGGKNTEIDAETKHVIIESATFSLYHLRKTQMKHGIFSEAITRFTKGQPAGMTMPVLSEAVKALGVEPLAVADCFPAKPSQPVISLSLSDINGLLGTAYDAELVKSTLENVGFIVEGNFAVKAPFWRTDIHIKEDIIEEVGRLLGYDNIPLDFAKRPFIGAKEDPLLTLKNRVRDILSDQLAANEVLTYSFVSAKLQETVGENPEDSYKIVNSISPELQRFRQTITPSLLEKTAMNLKSGFKNFSLYEINQVTNKKYGLNAENVPEMKTHLAFVTIGDFYAAKADLEALLQSLNVNINLVTPEDIPDYYEKKHSATFDFGYIGEIKSKILKNLKIAEKIAVFELDLEKLLETLPKSSQKQLKFSRFPSVSRDITLKLKPEIAFKAVQEALEHVLAENCGVTKVKPVSLYQKDSSAKNLSFNLTFASEDHTLSADEISDIMKKVEKTVKSEFAAEIV